MNVLEKINTALSEEVLNESGIRNIKELAKSYKTAEIFFHQDLDGVTSAIAMKHYLEGYNIKTTDCHMINYGSMEYTVPKPKTHTLHVMVDFAHGKDLMMHIHTDHHEGQVGVSKTTSTSFVHTPSNAEYLSAIIPKSDAFPQEDLKLISMVDSAAFAKNNITPDDVMRAAFKVNKNIDVEKNRTYMGLVVNKLLLAYKNKKQFLEQLVLMAQPSLINMYNIITYLAKKEGYRTSEELETAMSQYVENQLERKRIGEISDINTLKTGDSMMFDNVVVQYGSSALMSKTVLYDRYTVFKNNPDAEYLIMMWPLGLIQVTVNPFKKGVNKHHLGDLAMEVLEKYKSKLKAKKLSFDWIKNVFERDIKDDSMGFGMNDFLALFEKYAVGLHEDEWFKKNLKIITDKPFKDLTDVEHKKLRYISVTAWDLIKAQSGGHFNITNLSGWSFIGKGYVDLMKDIAIDIVKALAGKHLE